MTMALGMRTRKTLRSCLQEDRLLVGVGAGDALQARLISDAEFDFVWISSFGVASSLALPEDVSSSLPDFNGRVREIGRAAQLPMIVDSPATYVKTDEVAGLVDLYRECGIDGICIEDKTGFKTNSLDRGSQQRLMPVAEFVAVMREIRRNHAQMFVICRVEAFIAGYGVDEAIRRAECYADNGADAVIIHSSSNTPHEVLSFLRLWDRPCPLGLIPTTYSSLTEEKIQEFSKVKLVIYANQLLRAAVKAQDEVLEEIKRTRGVHQMDDRLSTMARVFALQGGQSIRANEEAKGDG